MYLWLHESTCFQFHAIYDEDTLKITRIPERMTGDNLQLGPLRKDVALGGDYMYLLSGSKVSG